MERSPVAIAASTPLSRNFSCLLVLVALVCLAGCGSVPSRDEGSDGASQSSSQEADAVTATPGDPLEGLNRATYVFNDKLDRYLLKPVAQGYSAVVPGFARRGISNFFSNLYDPAIMLNNLLQGKLADGASDLGRFLVNSTVGVAGLFDVASDIGLEKHNEDFGQTFAVWGIGEGPYLVLPILGPSNFRDGFGLAPDWALYPPSYLEDVSTRNAVIVVEAISRRSQLLDAGDILDQAAGEDPYVFVREAYRQRRQNLIYDGNPPVSPVDPSLFEDDAPAQPGEGKAK